MISSPHVPVQQVLNTVRDSFSDFVACPCDVQHDQNGTAVPTFSTRRRSPPTAHPRPHSTPHKQAPAPAKTPTAHSTSHRFFQATCPPPAPTARHRNALPPSSIVDPLPVSTVRFAIAGQAGLLPPRVSDFRYVPTRAPTRCAPTAAGIHAGAVGCAPIPAW